MIFASVRHNVRGRRGGRQPREACPLPLPDRPSIAALPLDNVSGNKDQDYFCDGITDDTIVSVGSRLPCVAEANHVPWRP